MFEIAVCIGIILLMINLLMIAHDVSEIKENMNKVKDKLESKEQLKLEEESSNYYETTVNKTTVLHRDR